MTKAILIVGFYFLSLNLLNANDAIMQAMRDEIKRSLDEIKLDKIEKPYYIEYTLTITHSHNIRAYLGSLLESDDTKSAYVNVGVRIGDYKFDNSNFLDFGFSLFGSADDEEPFKRRMIPKELDYDALRRELWLATDAAYKQASEVFAKKNAVLENRLRKDTTWDFIKLDPIKLIDTIQIPSFDLKRFEDYCTKVSSVFASYADIFNSSVNLEFIPQTIYYVNSEGREYIKTEMFSGLEVAAISQSSDGMPLTDFYYAYSRDPKNLPKIDSVLKAAYNLADNLVSLKNAQTIEESYSGPVLFEGQASAEAIAQIFAPNFVAMRSSLTESGIQEASRFNAFQNKIGGRVLPEWMSVDATPALRFYQNTELVGSFEIDDQGVKADNVNLVKAGFLKNLLSSRTPTKRVRASNGHVRGGGTMLSIINFESDSTHISSSDSLKKKLLELCKDRELPYGIIVRKVMNQNILQTTVFRLQMGAFSSFRTDQRLNAVRAYKLYPDGREELIRGALVMGLTPQSFKDILLTSKNKYALNYLAPSIMSSFMTGGSQYVGATIIAPDLLFEDCEIKADENDFPKPPILKSPLSNK